MKIENAILLFSVMHVITFAIAAVYSFAIINDGWIIFFLMLFGNYCSVTYFELKRRRDGG